MRLAHATLAALSAGALALAGAAVVHARRGASDGSRPTEPPRRTAGNAQHAAVGAPVPAAAPSPTPRPLVARGEPELEAPAVGVAPPPRRVEDQVLEGPSPGGLRGPALEPDGDGGRGIVPPSRGLRGSPTAPPTASPDRYWAGEDPLLF